MPHDQDPETYRANPRAAPDLGGKLLGPHPFAVQVYFGDERIRAYKADSDGGLPGPGLQLLTHTSEALLAQPHQVGRGQLLEAAQRLRVGVPFLLNVACQSSHEQFLQRIRNLTTATGGTGINPDDQRTLDALKLAIDEAQALGPQAIVSAAMAHLADGSNGDGSRYGNLVAYANRALASPRNAEPATRATRINGADDIAAGGVDLWWIKEGSTTIVLQVLVHLAGGRPPVRFALNVAKDLTRAADELRQVHADLVELHEMDPAYVMQPFGMGHATVPTWRGTRSIPVLAAEWFDGHELHVYAGSSRLHLWQDQRMGKEHPLAKDVSDEVWETIVRVCARYTRITPHGLIPLGAHINAGDFIFRQRADDAWDILLIWCRRPPPGSLPGEFVVIAGLLAASRAFGPERDATVWWDQPERALEAIRAGLTQAGLSPSQVTELLRQAHDGPFTAFETSPERIPYLAQIDSGDHAELCRVFSRAKAVLAQSLAGAAG